MKTPKQYAVLALWALVKYTPLCRIRWIAKAIVNLSLRTFPKLADKVLAHSALGPDAFGSQEDYENYLRQNDAGQLMLLRAENRKRERAAKEKAGRG
jgi:hypothetical protein